MCLLFLFLLLLCLFANSGKRKEVGIKKRLESKKEKKRQKQNRTLIISKRSHFNERIGSAEMPKNCTVKSSIPETGHHFYGTISPTK